MRQSLKEILNRICQLLALPFALTCWLESFLRRGSEVVFVFWANVFALLPGLPGVFLRRAFYSMTLQECALNCHIGFGSMFSHRCSVVKKNVYIGNYCCIGSAILKKNCLIGSRASLLSGGEQHTHNDDTGEWEAFSAANIRTVTIGENAWIGEAAIIMANVGTGSQIAAGAVITTATKSFVVLAGNPARFVKKLPVSEEYHHQESALITHEANERESVKQV